MLAFLMMLAGWIRTGIEVLSTTLAGVEAMAGVMA